MSLLPPSRFFPPAEDADADGLIGFGGKLTPPWLLDAYSHGIFPWPVGDIDWPVAWWSPDPRAIIELDRFHVSRRLRRTCKSGKFTVSLDRDFSGVIHGCATAGARAGQTWLTKKMIAAYIRLHRLAHAHSVEVWHEEKLGDCPDFRRHRRAAMVGENGTVPFGPKLAGGVYGVALGGLFAAESMFYRVRDASKVALVYLVEHLRQRGYVLLDIQQLTPHTVRFGAIEIPRREYLARLAKAIILPVSWKDNE